MMNKLSKSIFLFVIVTEVLCIHIKGAEFFCGPANDILRFHIIANSDSKEDQELKMKVKSVVASEVSADMQKEGIASGKQAKEYLRIHSQKYVTLARATIKEEGYNYKVTTTLGRHWFPIRVYGSTVYPEGEYEAYRMVIGKGEGKNWWCVLFPSLCMVDEACQIDAESVDTENNCVEIKSAFVEWFKQMW